MIGTNHIILWPTERLSRKQKNSIQVYLTEAVSKDENGKNCFTIMSIGRKALILVSNVWILPRVLVCQLLKSCHKF
jgi:hypothetical protein